LQLVTLLTHNNNHTSPISQAETPKPKNFVPLSHWPETSQNYDKHNVNNWWRNLRERDNFEDPGVDARWENNIEMDLQKVG
jgi:hypothetical protein